MYSTIILVRCFTFWRLRTEKNCDADNRFVLIALLSFSSIREGMLSTFAAPVMGGRVNEVVWNAGS